MIPYPDAWFKIEIKHECLKCKEPVSLPTLTIPTYSQERMTEIIEEAKAEEREACAHSCDP